MDEKVVKNPEFKGVIIRIFIIFFIFNIFVIISLNSIWRSLNVDLINKNIAVIGAILEESPELEDKIMGLYTREINESDLEKGISTAYKYGYTPKVQLKISPIVNKYYEKSILINIILSLLSFIAVFSTLTYCFRGVYSRIRYISIGTEKIMDGNFNVRFPEEEEGELSKLGFQFNQMSKRLQLTLEELRGEKEFLRNVISDISHQLKTPLTSLKMFNELLLDGADEQKEIRREFLEKSFVQLDRMEWLTHTMLKMARLETGVIELNKEDEDLVYIINEEIKSLYISFKNKNQRIKTNNLDKPIYFLFDCKWIGEALRNIIKNSIDYTPEGGEIDISVEETESLIRIKIKDNGIGILEQDIPHIFERFYQGRNSKEVTQNGSGVGLALTKLIVEKHNGIIEVESNIGIGTEFIVIFPKGISKNS